MSDQRSQVPDRPPLQRADLEIAVCAAWREQHVPEPLRTVADQPVEVIHRGRWCAECGCRAGAAVDGGRGGGAGRGRDGGYGGRLSGGADKVPPGVGTPGGEITMTERRRIDDAPVTRPSRN